MSTEKKKKPSEYPLFAFRIDEEKKEELNNLLEETREALNRKIGPEDKLWMKNDIIYEALLLGLPLLKKQNK
jgi:hypothetical protein